jgi:hypothetical protein
MICRALAAPFLLEAERAVRTYRREFNAGLTVARQLCHVADSYVATGRTGEATRVLAEAQELMEQHGDVYWEPELFRLRGRLAAAEGRGASIDAVRAFERALRPARERGAHLLELRAATDLARLQATQGQPWRRARCWSRSTTSSSAAPTSRTCVKPARCWRAWTGSGA